MVDGETISSHMKSRPDIYDNMLVTFLTVGEQTADFSGTAQKVADLHSQGISQRVEALGALLEPILIAGVAGAVATICWPCSCPSTR